MKKFVLRLRNHFLALLGPKPMVRPAFDIQQKIKNVAKKNQTEVVAAIPMAQVTIQTIQIPLVGQATMQKALQASQVETPSQRQRQPNIIRRPLSEKDIADLSSVLKSFPGNDVRDLF